MFEDAELGRKLSKKEYDRALPKLRPRMVQTEYAPWTLVAGNDNKFARIQILKMLCAQLERAL